MNSEDFKDLLFDLVLLGICIFLIVVAIYELTEEHKETIRIEKLHEAGIKTYTIESSRGRNINRWTGISNFEINEDQTLCTFLDENGKSVELFGTFSIQEE